MYIILSYIISINIYNICIHIHWTCFIGSPAQLHEEVEDEFKPAAEVKLKAEIASTAAKTSLDVLAAKEAKPESQAEQAQAVQDTPAAASSKPEQEDDYHVAFEEDVVSAGTQENEARRAESAVEEVKSIGEVEEVTEVPEKQETQVNEETPSKPLDTPLETSSDALAAKEAKPESQAEQAGAVQDTPAAASSKPEQEDDYHVAFEEDVVSAGTQENEARRAESAVEEVKSIGEVEEVTEVPEKQETQVNEETPSKPLDTPLETSSDALAAKEAKPESQAEQAGAVQDTPAAASSKPEQEDDYHVAFEEDVGSAGTQENEARRTESAAEEVKSIGEVEEVTEVPEKQEIQVNEETPSKPLDTPPETSSEALAAKEAKPESHAEQAGAVQDTPSARWCCSQVYRSVAASSKPEQEDDYRVAFEQDVGSAGTQDNEARRTESAVVEEVKSIGEVEEVTEVPEKQETQVNEETPSKPLDTPLETSSDALAAKEAKPESQGEQAGAVQDTPAARWCCSQVYRSVAASSKPEQEDDYHVAFEEDVVSAGTQENEARRTESAVEEVKSIGEVEEVTEVPEKQETQVNEETPSKPLDTPLETSSDALAAKEAKPESHAEQAGAVQDTPAAASSKPEQEDDYHVAFEEDVVSAGTQENEARRTESAVEEVKSIGEVEEVTEVPEKQEIQVNEETPSKPLDTPLETSSDALAAKEAKPESQAEQAGAVQDTPAAASSKPEQEDDYHVAFEEDVGSAGTQENEARRTESAVEEVVSKETGEVTPSEEKPVFAQEDSGLNWMLSSSEKATEDISTVDLHAASVLRVLSWSHFFMLRIASPKKFPIFFPARSNGSNTAP